MIVIMHEFYHQGVSMRGGVTISCSEHKARSNLLVRKTSDFDSFAISTGEGGMPPPAPLKETLQVYSVLYYIYAKCIHVPSHVLCRFDGRMFNYKLFFEQDMHFVGQCSFTNFMCKVIYIVLNVSQSAS